MRPPDYPKDYVLDGAKDRPARIIYSLLFDTKLQEEHNWKLFRKFQLMEQNEVRYETFLTDDAEMIVVAYGIAARIAKGAIKRLRQEGLKVGLIRPITLWPFPAKALQELAKTVNDFFVFEMSTGPDGRGRAARPRRAGHRPLLRPARRRHPHARSSSTASSPATTTRPTQARGRSNEDRLRATQAAEDGPLSTTAPAAATASSTACSWRSSTRWTSREKAICVAPAGCGMLLYNYFDIDMVESAHGRGAAVATGIKRVLPDNLVFSYQGDGDLAAIGTAESFHAANRGENITVIFVNNGVYGMTGGQMAPTTLLDQVTTTTPRGRDSHSSRATR